MFITLTTRGKKPSHHIMAVILAISGTFGLGAFAHAQNAEGFQTATPGHRKIPANARLGQAQLQQQNVLAIDGISWVMSPGATVRDERNMLGNVTALYEKKAVRFTANPQGMVDKLWILSADEATDEALDNAGVQRPSLIRDVVNGVMNTLF